MEQRISRVHQQRDVARQRKCDWLFAQQLQLRPQNAPSGSPLSQTLPAKHAPTRDGILGPG